ncbi:MAG: hypothetical protein DMF90_06390 [Acidobacteria bacterium]|nr:MAG: hypothetical protein DMF90_06390 [Acidobacteriota bacterium]
MRRFRGSLLLAALCVAAWAAGGAGSAGAQTSDPAGSRRFSAAEQIAIARAFAPMLVFHAEEHYFPISSMFLLPSERGADTEAPATPEVHDQLGSAEERAARYKLLPQQDKLSRAAVGYRVFSRFKRGQTEVIVEYWCHYVYNEFTIRGTWFPYRISGNHTQDLERLFLVLVPTGDGPRTEAADEVWARAAFRIERIVANAHDGSVPPNEYDVRDGRLVEPPVTILVERGSHAMAPDINHDGRFTPGEDSTTNNKLLWGIRDAGRPWGWYRKSQMDARNPGRTVRLCNPKPRRGYAGGRGRLQPVRPLSDREPPTLVRRPPPVRGRSPRHTWTHVLAHATLRCGPCRGAPGATRSPRRENARSNGRTTESGQSGHARGVRHTEQQPGIRRGTPVLQ